jgi:glycosyltransferase
MKNNSKISIITASFNSAKTISDTLDSVNAQTYPEIEHVIIDGASTDKTIEIINSLGRRIAYLISEPDDGIFDAYNKGLKIASGEIIGILNSDDFYATPHIIENIMKVFEDTSVEAVFADLVYVDKVKTSKVVRYWKSRPYKDGDFSRGITPAHPTLFIRQNVYVRTGGFNPSFRFAGDIEFMLRVFHVHGVKSIYLPEIAVCMRTGGATGGSLSSIKKQNGEILNALSSYGVNFSASTFFVYKSVDRLKQFIRAIVFRVLS